MPYKVACQRWTPSPGGLAVLMFTGIVQGKGTVHSMNWGDGIVRLIVDLPSGRGAGLETGASVALAGVCLTVVAFDGDQAEFDVIDETLRRTTLGDLAPGSAINVERAARFGDEIGGHLISGHVWGIGTVTEVEDVGDNRRVRIKPPTSLKQYILEKGYISLNGASLTIGRVQEDGSFDIHLIPETLRLTTFDGAHPGSRINIEVDAQTQAIVDTVTRLLSERNN